MAKAIGEEIKKSLMYTAKTKKGQQKMKIGKEEGVKQEEDKAKNEDKIMEEK